MFFPLFFEKVPSFHAWQVCHVLACLVLGGLVFYWFCLPSLPFIFQVLACLLYVLLVALCFVILFCFHLCAGSVSTTPQPVCKLWPPKTSFQRLFQSRFLSALCTVVFHCSSSLVFAALCARVLYLSVRVFSLVVVLCCLCSVVMSCLRFTSHLSSLVVSCELFLSFFFLAFDPGPLTLDPSPFTLHPWTLNLDPCPLTLDAWPLTLDPWPLTLDPWHLTLEPWPMTLDPWNLTE